MLYAGLVPSAVMVTASPFARAVASVKVTLAPAAAAALTVSVVAEPPEGVYVTRVTGRTVVKADRLCSSGWACHQRDVGPARGQARHRHTGNGVGRVSTERKRAALSTTTLRCSLRSGWRSPDRCHPTW